MCDTGAGGGVQAYKLPGLMEDLTSLLAQLRAIQKGLTEFLETKRAIFPRFHYLSSEDMFEILGGVEKDANAIQPHLCKCFAGMRPCLASFARPAGGAA